MLLFHGVYGRMYSLFLFTSLLSFLALLEAATETGGRLRWAAWIAATLLCIAAHPYGALVLATQAVYVAARGCGSARRRVVRDRPRAGHPVLAHRPRARRPLRDRRRRRRRRRLGSPLDVLALPRRTFGDFTAGYRLADRRRDRSRGLRRLPARAIAAAERAPRRRGRAHPRGAAHARAVRLGGGARVAPSHLRPAVLPRARRDGARLRCAGSWAASRRRRSSSRLRRSWRCRSPGAGRRRPSSIAASPRSAWRRAELTAAAGSQRHRARDDVLFGYDPLFLEAWRAGGDLSRSVVPRADPSPGAARPSAGRAARPRASGCFDASDTGNPIRRLEVPNRPPTPRDAFETRTFGPFMVVRTVAPTGDVRSYLKLARQRPARGQGALDRRRGHEPAHDRRGERSAGGSGTRAARARPPRGSTERPRRRRARSSPCAPAAACGAPPPARRTRRARRRSAGPADASAACRRPCDDSTECSSAPSVTSCSTSIVRLAGRACLPRRRHAGGHACDGGRTGRERRSLGGRARRGGEADREARRRRRVEARGRGDRRTGRGARRAVVAADDGGVVVSVVDGSGERSMLTDRGPEPRAARRGDRRRLAPRLRRPPRLRLRDARPARSRRRPRGRRARRERRALASASTSRRRRGIADFGAGALLARLEELGS